MMNPSYADPFALWKNFYDELEPKVSESLQQMLGSEAYAALSAQLLSTSLQMEQRLSKNMEVLLQTLKMPSQRDIERLGELLVGIEEKIDLLDARLDGIEQQINISQPLTTVTDAGTQKPEKKNLRMEKDNKN